MIEITDRKYKSKAYSRMMEDEAWQDLEQYAKNEQTASLKRIDDKPAADLSINSVCEERGFRKGILKILQHANECRNGI